MTGNQLFGVIGTLVSDFFMEYNIYLENNKFYLSDIDKSIAFTNNIMFYEHHKRMDVLKYMNLELKSENLIKVLYDVYNKMLPHDERKRIDMLEMMDEFEEFDLLQRHACFGYGLSIKDTEKYGAIQEAIKFSWK